MTASQTPRGAPPANPWLGLALLGLPTLVLRLLLAGAAAFALSSLLAAYATSPDVLIAARALMGVSGATLMPSTLAIIGELFPDPAAHGTAIGVWVACFMGGIAFGPLVGGALLSAFWWGSVFLLALPVMAALLLLGPRVLPKWHESRPGAVHRCRQRRAVALCVVACHVCREGAGP